mgnify:FL=1
MNLDELLSEFTKKFFRNVYIEYGEDIKDIKAFSFNKWGDRLKSAIRWRVDGIKYNKELILEWIKLDGCYTVYSKYSIATRLFHPKLIKMRLGEDLIYRRVL